MASPLAPLYQKVHTVPEAADNNAVERNLARLKEHIIQMDDNVLAMFWESLLMDGKGKRILACIFGNSPYLTGICFKQLAFAREVFCQDVDVTFQALLLELWDNAKKINKKAELMALLRCYKQKAAFLIAVADITQLWPLEAVTKALSQLAETSVQIVVEFLLQQAVAGEIIELPTPSNMLLQQHSGLIILAMGKLGAEELNYSSDIDIMVFYDPQKIQYLGKESLQYFLVALVRDMVHYLEERTRDGYVFRVDLRLRPDPSSTPVAISIDAAYHYYESVGQNWERAVMIKGRPIAGDKEAGNQFLQELRPYIWRKYLDFASIQDIHSIKRQISSTKEKIPEDLSGYNIKIGHGGIREIEFFAQTQQLIWGGRDIRLRSRSTCDTLEALAESKKITPGSAKELADIYRYLRTLEHRIQMVADNQTHAIPKTAEAIEKLAIFMGYTSSATFFEEVHKRLLIVQSHYARLFTSSPELGYKGSLVFTGSENDPETLETLQHMGYTSPNTMAQIIRQWHHGRHRCTRTKRARELITELMPKILKAFANTHNPDAAFIKFDEFLSMLPSSAQLFSLFTANPHLLVLIAEILGSYPYLAETLSRKPQLLEYVLYPGFFIPIKDREELSESLVVVLEQAKDYQDVLEVACNWAHEREFRVGVLLIQQVITPREARDFLSDIAETLFVHLLEKIKKEFSSRRGEIAGGQFVILAIGKLGSREFTFGSDIDLMFVHHTPVENRYSDGGNPLIANEYYTRLSRRVISAFSSMTAVGKLYNIDIRLRPSGNDGPIASSLGAFIRYYNESAWVFEFMALTHARVIAGDSDLAKRVGEVIHQQLVRPRDKEQLVNDIKEMREKVEKQYPAHNPWNIKYVRGGLLDCEFLVQYLQLLHAHHHPEIINIKTVQAFSKLEEAGILSHDVASFLQESVAFFQDVQSLLRLAYNQEIPSGLFSGGLKKILVSMLKQPDFETLEKVLISKQIVVKGYFDAIIRY